MYKESVQATRDLVEAVVLKLGESRVDAEEYVPELCEALLYCPDRQMATLNMMYSALYAKRDAKLFEYFVENEIATLKRYILDIMVTPGTGTQNVHVQNYWRYELGEKLGFKEEYKPRMGTFDQDRFEGHVGSVLDVFYTKFTPKYVVEKLVEEINGRKERWTRKGLSSKLFVTALQHVSELSPLKQVVCEVQHNHKRESFHHAWKRCQPIGDKAVSHQASQAADLLWKKGKHVIAENKPSQLYHASFLAGNDTSLLLYRQSTFSWFILHILSGRDTSWFPLSRSTSSCKETHIHQQRH
ncbi:UNVERIFIED_CONTAM: hypothetical protein PYX00_011647 [Menopon gallinae]|uniref:Uncharacterized protein n=1 Tax=Menopon gallinae TaxID=328185 RepID=A0AAW2H867_9NEOP